MINGISCIFIVRASPLSISGLPPPPLPPSISTPTFVNSIALNLSHISLVTPITIDALFSKVLIIITTPDTNSFLNSSTNP